MPSEEIDAGWLMAALENQDLPNYQAPEVLSSYFESRATLKSLGEFERRVLHVVASATSAMLNPTDWQDPFKPSIEWDSQRSRIPSDFDPDELALVARIVPLVDRSDLKARLADISWTYGNRSNTAMLDVAIDSYRTAPLTADVWFSAGRDAWQRAFELTKRRGPAAREQVDDMSRQLKDRLLISDSTDQFLAVSIAETLRQNGRTRSDDKSKIADHLVDLARSALSISPRLSRHLEREAEGWFEPSDVESRLASIERRGRSYIAEADSRLAFDKDAGGLVEGPSIEKAIAVLLTLPRKYRQSNAIDALIQELRVRLRGSRQTTLETMIQRTTDPIELTAATAQARAQVSGHTDRFDALAAFVLLFPPMDEGAIRESAAKIAKNSIRRLFGSTTLSGDGRKVASSTGSVSGADESVVWGEMVGNVTSQAQTMAQGFIQPAQSVLTFEHHFDRDYFVELCIESPVVPEGHAVLWGAGLAMGLNHDYGPAVALIVPQLEHAIRTLLNRNGTHTLFVDDSGVESEKSLNALLDMSETTTQLGAGAVMELKALLVFQGGFNLRNEIAHGLVADVTAWSLASVYVWWFALRFVLSPVILMRRRDDTEKADDPAEPSPA